LRIVGRGSESVAAGSAAIGAGGKAMAGEQLGEAGRWRGVVIGGRTV
jgi:hypothetical protein